MTLLAHFPGTTAWRKRRAMKLCHATAERIQEIVDGELPPSRKVRLLERHLAACERCQGEAEIVRQLKRAIARVANEADPGMVGRLNDLAQLLCEEPGTGV
ncbi:MAG: anti-sigma factor family protein [Candidatus Binatia bacterium]